MAGLVQVILSDHELDTILKWAELADAETGTARERGLIDKLRGFDQSVACKVEGKSCPVPTRAVTPADVRS